MTLDRSRPPEPTAARPFGFGAWESRRLAGGPRLMVMREPRIPLVHLEIVLALGADRDPTHLRGLTSLGAGLLDEGTDGLDAPAIARTVEQLGASLETTADWDGVYVSTSSLSEHLLPLFELAARIALEPTLPPDELERTRRARLADLEHRLSQPAFLAGLHAADMLYGPDHPYGASFLGTAEGLRAVARDDIERWHAARARPEIASVVAVGDTTLDEIESLCGEHLTAWPDAAPEPDRPVPPEPGLPVPAPRRIRLIDRPGATQTELRIARVGPSRLEPDYVTARLTSLLLGGKFTSRLNLNLRERLGITYGVHSSLGGRRGPGPFGISCAVDTEAAGRGVGEILAELDRMVGDPPPEAELEDGKSYLLGTFPYRLQTIEGLADHLAEIAVYERPDDYFDRLPDLVREVTPADVQRRAATLLRSDDLAIVAVGPADALAARLEPFGPVEVHPETPPRGV